MIPWNKGLKGWNKGHKVSEASRAKWISIISRKPSVMMTCERCKKEIPRNSWAQKYCGNYKDHTSCSYIMQKMRVRLRYRSGEKPKFYKQYVQVRLDRDMKGNIIGRRVEQIKIARDDWE